MPFLVEKLQLRVLPCVMAFVHGISKDKLIGFQEFGNSDAFTTAALEWRLGRTGMFPIRYLTHLGVLVPQQKANKPILGLGAAPARVDDDDWDD